MARLTIRLWSSCLCQLGHIGKLTCFFLEKALDLLIGLLSRIVFFSLKRNLRYPFKLKLVKINTTEDSILFVIKTLVLI